MSRRKTGIKKDYVMIRVVCVCGLALGKVFRDEIPGRPPRYVVSKSLEFRDLPEPTPESGKVVRRCPECGATFQRRWDKLREALDVMATRGITSAEVSP